MIYARTMHICEFMKIEAMVPAVGQATDLLKSLASRNRLLLLCALVEGERSVGELARLIVARDTAVSQQLALLRKDGLVRARKNGQTVYYSLASPEAAKVIETLHSIYCAPQHEIAGRDAAVAGGAIASATSTSGAAGDSSDKSGSP